MSWRNHPPDCFHRRQAATAPTASAPTKRSVGASTHQTLSVPSAQSARRAAIHSILSVKSPTAAAGLKGDGGLAPQCQEIATCAAAWMTAQRHT